jgi:hypothetical protein
MNQKRSRARRILVAALMAGALASLQVLPALAGGRIP